MTRIGINGEKCIAGIVKIVIKTSAVDGLKTDVHFVEVGIYNKMTEFKYILVGRDRWTQDELDKLNVEYKGICKWMFGN